MRPRRSACVALRLLSRLSPHGSIRLADVWILLPSPPWRSDHYAGLIMTVADTASIRASDRASFGKAPPEYLVHVAASLPEALLMIYWWNRPPEDAR